jgi:glutamate racemase
VLGIYLDEALAEANAHGYALDTVLLGCTHYPLLREMLKDALPKEMTILDSAEATANRVRQQLETGGMQPEMHGSRSDLARCHFFATDSVGKFRTLGSRFLGQPIEKVELIDLGG